MIDRIVRWPVAASATRACAAASPPSSPSTATGWWPTIRACFTGSA